MTTKKTSLFSFGECHVQDRNTLRVLAQIDRLVEAGSNKSSIMRWEYKDGKPGWGAFHIDWNAKRFSRILTPNPHICAISAEGDAMITPPAVTEKLDATKNGPVGRGPISDVKAIGRHFYAVGMSRQVYRREGTNKWVRFDGGTVQELGAKDAAGFTSVDGLNDDDIYAVGFLGEIWRCQKGKWTQMNSPTNVVLHKVRVVRDDLVYICGQDGVLIRGDGGQWELVDHGMRDELSDIWSLEWYNDTLYLVDDDTMYTLSKDDTIKPVKLGVKGDLTFGHLHANDGVLLSSGPKHVLYTSDGKKWNDITP